MSSATSNIGAASSFSGKPAGGGGPGGGVLREKVILNGNHLHGNSSSSLSPPTTHINGFPPQDQHNPPPKKRNQPRNQDPTVEVIALSPESLMAIDWFMCQYCDKGFRREQNLQLHLRGHNLPGKLKVRPANESNKKKVYVCPESACLHHDPAQALSDITGIKKHFLRKHGEKKWKCYKCTKTYAVQSDCKAHSKICRSKVFKWACPTSSTSSSNSREGNQVTHGAAENSVDHPIEEVLPPIIENENFLIHRVLSDALAASKNSMAEMVPEKNLVSSSLNIHNNKNGFSDQPETSKKSVLVQELLRKPPPKSLNDMPAAAGSMFSQIPAAVAGSLFGGCAVSMSSMESPMMNEMAPSPFPMYPQTDYHYNHGGFVNQLLMQMKPTHLQEIPSQFTIRGFRTYQPEYQRKASLNLHSATNSYSSSLGGGGGGGGGNNDLQTAGLSSSRFCRDMRTVDYIGVGESSSSSSSRRAREINLNDTPVDDAEEMERM